MSTLARRSSDRWWRPSAPTSCRTACCPPRGAAVQSVVEFRHVQQLVMGRQASSITGRGGERGDRLPWLAAADAPLLIRLADTAWILRCRPSQPPSPGLSTTGGHARPQECDMCAPSLRLLSEHSATLFANMSAGGSPPHHPPGPLRARGFAAAHVHPSSRSVGPPTSKGSPSL